MSSDEQPTSDALPADSDFPSSQHRLDALSPWDSLTHVDPFSDAATSPLLILSPIFSPNSTFDDPCRGVWGAFSGQSVLDIVSFPNESLAERLRRDLERVVKECGVSLERASLLLRMNGWDCESVISSCLESEEEGEKTVKNAIISGSETDGEVDCSICWEPTDPEHMITLLDCGHRFCIACLSSFCHEAIDLGCGCLLTQCPHMSSASGRCETIVPERIFRLVCPDDDKLRYDRFLLQAFVAHHPRITWCPGRDCGGAIETTTELTPEEQECGKWVFCGNPGCRMEFCFVCSRPWHPLVSCKEMTMFEVELAQEGPPDSEALSKLFIQAHCKACPNCHKMIKKEEGCAHMTCRQCQHQFCWACLGAWAEHGGTYTCTLVEERDRLAEAASGAGKDLHLVLNREKRFGPYRDRFLAKLTCEEFAELALIPEEIEEKKRAYCEATGNVMENAVFLSQAFEVIAKANRLLRHSSVFAFYHSRERRSLGLLSSYQKPLERELEFLAESLREPYPTLNRDMIYEKTREVIGHMKRFLVVTKEYKVVEDPDLMGFMGGIFVDEDDDEDSEEEEEEDDEDDPD